MVLTIAISLFFGLAAAIALAVCGRELRRGLAQWKAIIAELTAMDEAFQTKPHQPQTQPRALAGA